MNSLNLLCVARCLIQKDHETNSNSRCTTVIHLNLFFTGFVLEIQLKKFWFGRCCCVVLLENIYVSSLLLIFSAKWRCPSIDCLLENFFIRIWLENSFGKILCPLIRGVRLSECPLIGGSTVFQKKRLSRVINLNLLKRYYCGNIHEYASIMHFRYLISIGHIQTYGRMGKLSLIIRLTLSLKKTAPWTYHNFKRRKMTS